MMNSGDSLQVSIHDTKAGAFTEISDLTTHQQGTMVASERNGFRHIIWDPVDFTCQGAPYAFHPMYDTAAAPLSNGQPTAWTTWSAHTDNVAYDVETGHFEAPDSSTDLSDDETHRASTDRQSPDAAGRDAPIHHPARSTRGTTCSGSRPPEHAHGP